MTSVLKDFFTSRLLSSPVSRAATVVIGIGIVIRVALWLYWPINVDELHTVPIFLQDPSLAYIADFTSNSPANNPFRLPFFEVASAIVYVLVEPLFGVRAMPIFTLLTAIASLPLFFYAVEELFGERIALYGTFLLAVHPKHVVMSAAGYPVVASISFAIAMLYVTVTAEHRDSPVRFVTGGAAATVSYLMFLPAVFTGILTAVYVHVGESRMGDSTDWSLRRLLIPGKRTAAFVSVPSVVGVLYVVFGPIGKVMMGNAYWAQTSYDAALFSETYPLYEKVVRYVAYEYFDFWYHVGFDREEILFYFLDTLSDTLGSAFPIYLFGWVIITLFLTAILGLGLRELLTDQSRMAWYVIVWVAGYVVIQSIKNYGWFGAIQTRHVFPVFPAVCILFGVGAVSLTDLWRSHPRIRAVVSLSDVHVVFLLFLVVTPLLLSTAAHGAFKAEERQLMVDGPVENIEAAVEVDKRVAVRGPGLYHLLVYTDVNTVVSDKDEAGRTADYLAVVTRTGQFAPADREAIDRSVANGGCVVTNESIEQSGTGQTIRWTIVDLKYCPSE